MKIALFHNLGPGGAKRHLFEQVRVLRAHGHSLDLFVPAEANEDFLPLAPFCDSVRVFGAARAGASESGGGRLRRLAKAPLLRPVAQALWLRRHRAQLAGQSGLHREIATAIASGGYDVAYVHHCRRTLAPDLLTFLVGATPTVFCCHDTPRALVEWAARTDDGYDREPETTQRRKRLGRWVTADAWRFGEGEVRRFETNTRAAGVVLANSRYSRECLARLTGVDAQVCRPGVDSGFFSPTDPVARAGVLSVGALLPSKRHDFVIEAVGRIPVGVRPAVDVIGYESLIDGSGRGPEGTRLEILARDLGVRLRISRHVSDEALREAYQGAAVVAFAPYLEPFGVVALEAMACGAPVVGVAEGGVRETVVDGETGWLTERDPAAFAEAVGRLLAEPDLARRFGARGREVAATSWTWERSAGAAETYLRRAASKAV